MKTLNLQKLLVIDIETVSEEKAYSILEEPLQQLWGRKSGFITKDMQAPDESYKEQAGIYAEFGKVICISCGWMETDKFIVQSFYGDNEKLLLFNFTNFIADSKQRLCGHNIKEFDIPYLCRRMLINGIPLPKLLDIAGKKPWEVNFVDTLQLWKFGDYKHYTSLNLLCYLFNVPSPKQTIDGSQVGKVYWEDQDLHKIVEYCQNDVVSVFRLMQRWQQQEILLDKDVEIRK